MCLNKYCQFYIIFQLLGRLYQRCDAKKCNCPKGREHHLNGTKFEIVRCEVLIFLYIILHAEIYLIQLIQTVSFDHYHIYIFQSCGCGGIHIYCGNLLKRSPLYICEKHSNNERQMLDHIGKYRLHLMIIKICNIINIVFNGGFRKLQFILIDIYRKY